MRLILDLYTLLIIKRSLIEILLKNTLPFIIYYIGLRWNVLHRLKEQINNLLFNLQYCIMIISIFTSSESLTLYAAIYQL